MNKMTKKFSTTDERKVTRNCTIAILILSGIFVILGGIAMCLVRAKKIPAIYSSEIMAWGIFLIIIVLIIFAIDLFLICIAKNAMNKKEKERVVNNLSTEDFTKVFVRENYMNSQFSIQNEVFRSLIHDRNVYLKLNEEGFVEMKVEGINLEVPIMIGRDYEMINMLFIIPEK